MKKNIAIFSDFNVSRSRHQPEKQNQFSLKCENRKLNCILNSTIIHNTIMSFLKIIGRWGLNRQYQAII